jgi:hypothetical protein
MMGWKCDSNEKKMHVKNSGAETLLKTKEEVCS